MGNIKITQVRSAIDKSKRQKATIKALGIKKMNHTVTKDANAQIMGMVAKIAHLVKVEHC